MMMPLSMILSMKTPRSVPINVPRPPAREVPPRITAATTVSSKPRPAVGWPAFAALFLVYFAMAYLLIGSIFLTIGAMAPTVRDVQTLSMPATMLQLGVFFLATYAISDIGAPVEHGFDGVAAL